MKKILTNLSLIILTLWLGQSNAQNNWPREIPLDNGGKIVIYQPQPERFDNNLLSARAAVSIAEAINAEQTFGSIWFDANLSTDKLARTVTIIGLQIKEARFPAIKDLDQLRQYTNAIQYEVPKWNMQFSMDQLTSSVEQTKKLNDPNLKNDAPNIIYRSKPTTLIVIDGSPKVQMDDQLNLQKVVNTPSTIVLNPNDNRYYLYGGGLWYSSLSVLSGWSYAANLPLRIQQLNEKIQQQVNKNVEKNNQENFKQDTRATPTDIIVSTSPAELIQTEGSPTYQTVEGTNLLYVDNSLNDIFKDINTQQNYILISGRWYTSTSLGFGWTYVPADQLPADFAKIPEGNEKDGVLSSVAGTSAANEALMDAQIPQTAKIDRRTATTTVIYDGSPIFNPISGTNLLVAENSNITVIKSNINGMYYAVDNGVWYISHHYDGPWKVSIERPTDVNNIPADNIAYNVKYVNVYDYNDEYVYAGYTPGYLGCYVYGPTIVWGTGWHYHSWYRNHYYARPYTWGFGMTYNPWTGWSIGYESGYGLGWNYYNHNPYAHGWFGPRSYHPNYRHWGYNGGYYGRRDIEINHPRLNYGRPSGFSVNYPGRVNNHQSFEHNNHNGNLYHHVTGASTHDVDHNIGHWNSSTPTHYNGIIKGGGVGYPHSNNHSNDVYGKPITKPNPSAPNNTWHPDNNTGNGMNGNYNGSGKPASQTGVPSSGNINHPQHNNGSNNVDNSIGKPKQQEGSSSIIIGRPRNNDGNNTNHNGFGRPIQPEASAPNNSGSNQNNNGANNVDNSISKPKQQEGASPIIIGRPRNNDGNNMNHNGFGRPIIQPEASAPNNTSSPQNNTTTTPNVPKAESTPSNHVIGRPQTNPNVDRPLSRPFTRENNVTPERGNTNNGGNGQERSNNIWKPAAPTPPREQSAPPPAPKVQQEPHKANGDAGKGDFKRR